MSKENEGLQHAEEPPAANTTPDPANPKMRHPSMPSEDGAPKVEDGKPTDLRTDEQKKEDAT